MTPVVDRETACLWRPHEITSSVVEMARRTGTRAIFDLSGTAFESVGTALIQADARDDCVDLKLSANGLLDQSLEEFLGETGVSRIWVELHPALLDRPLDVYLQRMAELSPKFAAIPVIAAHALVSRIIRDYPMIGDIALKGSEAAGFVSPDGIFVLYGCARETIRPLNRKPRLHVLGGVATPEAAAAFFCGGARGIVFESVHWLTDLVKATDYTRQKISNLRPDHMELIGLNLGVPCRLFNKGNSKAVKELRRFAGSLCGDEIRDEQRAFFANRITTEAVCALDGRFDRDQLIPLGIEAAFASSFVRRFGSVTEDALLGFNAKIKECCAAGPGKVTAFQESPAASEMGTRYPFVQGAMSWITDVPEFALKVAEAGALPTIALGMMDARAVEEKLGSLPEVMADRAYAVNFIALTENPHRDAQLDWICRIKPKFAVIAAGDPSHARRLIDAGIEPIYIAPTEELLRLACAAGIRWLICEGNEAGGHVGQHTTATLAQMVTDLRNSEPDLLRDRRIVLAGGIFNRESAFMAAMLGADGVQMGTVYLTSKEIVDTGALTRVYREMICASEPGGTTVTGESTGLRVRSLITPKIDAICTLEREFSASPENEAAFRQKMEALAAGSLFVAARGLDAPGGAPVSEQECRASGQFMSGACAGALARVRSLTELHEELAFGALEGLPDVAARKAQPVTPSAPRVARAAGHTRERIAITGMSIVNSLGTSPEEVWAASVGLKSGIIAVPASKWNHEIFYHPRPRMPEKTYCKVGAFQTIDPDRKELGIPPQDFRTMTDSTKITMWLAHKAVEESGILDSDIPRERIGVLISQNSGEAAATLQDVIIRGAADKIVASVKRVVSLDPHTEKAVEEAVKAGRIAIDDTTLLGRLNCSAGGFICNKYGFMGPSYSVSAACATALVALYAAMQMIRNGIIDAAVVGGAEETLTPMHFLEFSALGALSGLSGIERSPVESSRPFDKDRDGMVLGEGGAMIVIEREAIAARRGARPHAFITSMGASNNHLGMVESSRETQKIAIKASFDGCSYGPDGVDLIECHATSTQQGDVEEVLALTSIIPAGSSTTLTSFKSQIGHTLGASGLNSMIRGIMGMKAQTLPATLNFREPDPEMGLSDSGLRILSQPADWLCRNGDPRRLQVNAFGFGGSNYVVQVEEAAEERDSVLVRLPETGTQSEFPDGLCFLTTSIGASSYRLGVVADSEDQAVSKVRNTEAIADTGTVAAKRLRSLARQGLHLGAADESAAPLAFVFPGQGSHYAGMGHELYQAFPVVKHWMDRAAEVADFDLLQLLFFDREEDLQKTRWQQPALFTMEYSMVQYLWSLGVRPTALAGHSLGELTALCLAGVYSFEDGFRLVNKRAQCMDKACHLHVDPGVMMAVDAPMELIEEKLRALEEVYITNINSPHQVVLGGNTKTVTALGEELKDLGYRRTLLRVSMAFHSPIMRCIHDELQQFVDGLEFHAPQIPVVSNTTMKPFPSDTREIKRIVMAHLESPVHWMQNVHSLWKDYGVRLFVEVGPRDILSNLITDAIESADCIQTCLPSAETVMYRTALAQLYAKGCVPVKRAPRFVAFPGTAGEQPAVAATARRDSLPARSVVVSPLQDVVQRTINGFLLESFGRFLRPMLLDAIRREHAADFTESQLDDLLAEMVGPVPQIAVHAEPVTLAAQPQVQAAPIAAPPVKQTLPQPEEEPETDKVAEAVIRIIMDATGYERDEIDLSMDLREDLSIRSSRLPVIMDALESHFGMKIELEDFLGVRTVGHIAERISAILEKQNGSATRSEAPVRAPLVEVPSAQVEQRPPTKRLVFTETPIPETDFRPVEADSMESVVVWSAAGGTGLRQKVGAVFRRDYGVTCLPMTFLKAPAGSEEDTFDLLTGEGTVSAVERLGELESLSGMVLVLDEPLEDGIKTVEDVAALLAGLFGVMKAFLGSPSKKFVVVLDQGSKSQGLGRLVYEGVLGMLLSTAHEYSSVQFRCVRIDKKTDLRAAIRGALNKSVKPVEHAWHDGVLHSRVGKAESALYAEKPALRLTPEDVVVFSGGGYGITAHLAHSLIPFGCKMVFLGRTLLDERIDHQGLLAEGKTSPADAERIATELEPGISETARDRMASDLLKGLEITRTLDRLRSAGVEAAYFPCDVTDPARVDEVIKEICRRYGKIAGVVHGAGILRDRFVAEMSPEDFAVAADVKLLGAWNLFRSTERHGLQFMTVLSSAAAIQGNPGQSNYSTGNRAMSALASHLREKHPHVIFKALMLPPVEGAGMADTPEIRAFMKRMNASYVHVAEIAELFCRELCLGPEGDVWVMFMGTLPELEIAPLDTTTAASDSGILPAGTGAFKRTGFPMIDAISRVDAPKGELEASRAFSLKRDLWIADHKPFKFLKYPLVSAIMALETFMEASRVLYPYLSVRGIRDARFIDMIECPPNVERFSAVKCRRVAWTSDEVVCDLVLETREISPSGRVLERMAPNYRAQVVLGANTSASPVAVPGFPVTNEELDSRPMATAEVLDWYQARTELAGRYRVMEQIDGSSSGAVRGSITYRSSEDFSRPSGVEYHYSPYLLESLMQLVNFYIVMREPSESRAMIPYGIGEMRFFRKLTDGERVIVEARIHHRTDEGISWAARAVDQEGRTVMLARDITMRWFTG
ncbi:MAG: SDR family NAD(P)-dependent oxidoreductase [Thermodesulfobacteriota bacterium]